MISKNNFYFLLYIIIFILLFIKIYEVKKPNIPFKINKIESFTNKKISNDKHIIINFGNSKTSKEVYQNNYLNTMNKLNRKMRQFQNSQELYDFYLNHSFLDITEKDEEVFRFMIITLLDRIDNKIVRRFIKNYLIDMTIVKGNNKLESGMPHTHNKTIIFPQSYFTSIHTKYKLNFIESMLENEGLTFIHEILHIHQRYNKNKYLELYKQWGFTIPEYINNIINFKRLNRHNPDGLKVNWVWNNNNKYYLIGAVFNDNSNNLTDTDYIAKEITRIDANIFNDNDGNTIHLDKFDNFINYFGINNNHYHPNEITAQYFEYYVNKYFLNNYVNIKNKGYLIFEKNIINILK